MADRPSRAELEARLKTDYTEYVRSMMKDFCFTIVRHTGQDRVWFGSHTVTINRNVAFNFFDRDVADDPGLENFPVMRAERTETKEITVRPYPEDPSANYPVTAFYLSQPDYIRAMDSMNRIVEGYSGLRTLPDAFFADEDIVALINKLLAHPAVQAERAADWPSFLK